MAEALKRSILKLGIEVDEKIFSKEELKAMDQMDPDYIAHMIANPDELKKVIERYGLAGKAQKELVAEVYSQPRVTRRACMWRMRGGWALDFSTFQPNGEQWNFDIP